MTSKTYRCESFNIEDIRVSTIKVPHTIHAIAYRFDYSAQSIVVTGDLTYSKELPELSKDADFMIIDFGGTIMSDACFTLILSYPKSVKIKPSSI